MVHSVSIYSNRASDLSYFLQDFHAEVRHINQNPLCPTFIPYKCEKFFLQGQLQRYIKPANFLLLDLKFLFENFLRRSLIFFIDIAIEWAI